jgi:hypothetical protein
VIFNNKINKKQEEPRQDFKEIHKLRIKDYKHLKIIKLFTLIKPEINNKFNKNSKYKLKIFKKRKLCLMMKKKKWIMTILYKIKIIL